MWNVYERDDVWSQLDQAWDIVVIGGGITGAGLFREAARCGARVLLIEARDFAWGTSSRSSKLVHGGLRYLKAGQLALARASVQERERLLQAGPGLIEPLGFLLASYGASCPQRWFYDAGLTVYDHMGQRQSHHYYPAEEFRMLAPHIARQNLDGGFAYTDAQTDDARLVLRTIREGVAAGGVALNYVQAEELIHDGGQVVGVWLRDQVQTRRGEVRARVVINATGAWADRLRGEIGRPPLIRPLRGSHLIFPAWRLPVAQAISFSHPIDGRFVFVLPWEGVTLVGTTDLDHDQPLDSEPTISPEEVAYLMAAVTAQFPALQLSLDDIIATFAGIRPVVSTGHADPSQESRDHIIEEEQGLLTVTGGKLTTFRLTAHQALTVARRRLPELRPTDSEAPALDPVDTSPPPCDDLDRAAWSHLLGRYGVDAAALVASARPGELSVIPDTPTRWVELRWAARAEGVVHLDDLLLRRTRLGLLLPRGGEALLPTIRGICQNELKWDDARWEAEQEAYRALWQTSYSLPDRALIPDWSELLAAAKSNRLATMKRYRRDIGTALAGGLAGLALAITLWQRRRVAGGIATHSGAAVTSTGL
jgi:glycerol-3-phosphate dehydrogenase